MAPKAKSKSEFERCNFCDVIVCAKHVDWHMVRYHGNGTTPTSPMPTRGNDVCINGPIVHGSAKEISTTDEACQRLPPFKINEIVCLNPSVMSLCGIPIGSWVLVWTANSAFVSQMAWPSRDSTGMSVGLSQNQLGLLGCKAGDLVHVTKLAMTRQRPAIELTLNRMQMEEWREGHDFVQFLVTLFDGKPVLPGSLLSLNYYGKPRHFQVAQIDDYLFPAVNNSARNKHNLPDHSTEQSDICHHLSLIDLSQDQSLDASFVSNVSSRSSISLRDSELSSTPKRRTGRKTKRTNDADGDCEVALQSPVAGLNAPRSSRHVVCACADTVPATGDVTYYVDSKTRVKLVKEAQDEQTGASDKSRVAPQVTFADIGGLAKEIERISQTLNLALTGGELFGAYGLRPQRGLLLFGPSGTGKSMIGRALAHSINYHFLVINGPELYSKFYGETEAKLRQIFQEAKERAPSVLFIDEIDSLCPRRENSSSSQEQRVVATLLTLMDQLPVEGVMVVAATNKIDSVDAAMRRPGRLDREIEIGIPTAKGREEILRCLLRGVSHDLSDSDIESVAANAHGYVGADLANVCSQAGLLALKRLDSEGTQKQCVVLRYSDIVGAAKDIKPSALRELQIEIPTVRWEDVGGQEELKHKLRQAVDWPLNHPQAFTRMGISPPRGVLMYGPPGCSKTLIAKALATESSLNFIAIKGPELFNKWVGESERAIRELFRKARAASPCIVFFDEIDALAAERGSSSSSSQVGDRVLAQLLSEIDGLEQLHGVTVVASTNRPDMIDKALLRPGRLDRIVYVPLPDAATRKEIFKIQFRKIPTASDVCVDDLVSSTDGYSGAEVVAVCNEAALKAMEDDLETEQVKMVHFRHSLLVVTPRISKQMIDFYENYSDKARKKLY